MQLDIPEEPREWAFAFLDLRVRMNTKAGRIQNLQLKDPSKSDESGRRAKRNLALRTLVKGRLFGTVPFDWSRLDTNQLTNFQRSVYEKTVLISPGERLTYKNLAEDLDNPEACQAVGQALGNNPFPVVIPCHRVIRSDGTLGGFCGRDENNLKQKLQHVEASF